MEWTRGKKILARLVKVAQKIEGKTVYAKMVCYLEKEREQKIPYRFDNKFPHGHYCLDFQHDLSELMENGFIDKQEIKTNPGKKFIYTPTPKLEYAEIKLSPRMEKSIVSILHQYKRYSSFEIEQYDHDIYRDKTRTDSSKGIREFRTTQMKQLLKEAKGNKEKALDLFLAQI